MKRGGYVNSLPNTQIVLVKRLVRKKPYRSLAKATRSCYAELNKCHPQSPPRHARRIIGLGKDVSREQRARHQASLGKESPAPAEENEPQGTEEADEEEKDYDH